MRRSIIIGIVIVIIVAILVSLWIYVVIGEHCPHSMNWIVNKETGKCRMHNSICNVYGYEFVDMENFNTICDCDNLEYPETPYRVNCTEEMSKFN